MENQTTEAQGSKSNVKPDLKGGNRWISILLFSNLLLLAAVALLLLNRGGVSVNLPHLGATAEATPHLPDVPIFPTVEVARSVSPAVVTVGTVAVRRAVVRNPYWDFYDRYVIRDVEERLPYLGSGVLIDDTGHIVTNHHVITQGDTYFVTFMDGREFPATLVDADPYIDVAVLKIEAEDLPQPIVFGDSENLDIGSPVMALGNPFGPMIADPRPTVTTGVVSAVGRRFRPDSLRQRVYNDMIQTDAAINPGNSGGPLVDMAGRLLGINTFIFSGSGGSNGVGFAIPSHRVQRIIQDVKKYGKIQQLWLDFDVVAGFTKNGRAIVVQRTAEDGPAETSGLRPGDIITSADGRRLQSIRELELYFLGKQVGETLELDVIDRETEEAKSILYEISAPPSPEL